MNKEDQFKTVSEDFKQSAESLVPVINGFETVNNEDYATIIVP